MGEAVIYTPRLYGATAAPALSIDGQFFRANGERWTAIQCSEFSLLKRWLENEDIEPILRERVDLGFNCFRVWTLNESVVGKVYPGGIHPNQYQDFYEGVHAFVDTCGNYGIAVELTAFTSCIPLMPKREDQIRHWQSLQDAVRGLPNVLLELVNEYNWGEGQNAPDSSLWAAKPHGIIASSGSATADAMPPEPVWDYGLYHTNGLDEWQRKVGHNTMHDIADVHHVPAMANENMRYPDDDDSPTRAYDAAAGAALLCAGACFHSQSGKYSRPFDAVEYAAAAAWVAGARSVPLEFQAGAYRRHDEMNSDTVMRAYSRTLPDGRAHLVLIHY